MPPSSSRTSVKRRQVRKGTFSCWECKRRKTRCEFKNGTGICAYCQRRGLSCIGQEFPDPVEDGNTRVEERIDQVESLVSQLVQQRRVHQLEQSEELPVDDNHEAHALAESADDPNRANNIRPSPEYVLPASHGQLPGSRSLSSHLYSILPHPTKAALIFNSGKFSSLPSHLHRKPPTDLVSSMTDANQLMQILELPSPSSHPARLARIFIQLALCLHHLDATTSQHLRLQLDEPVHNIARRYVRIASRFVTSQDWLMESLEGLEILVDEACFHINLGDLRAAWLIFRRALAIAQLLGLPRWTGRGGCREESIWFNLITGDRFLSLMLGLPFAVADNSFTRGPQLIADAPLTQLDHIHSMLMGRIIARNVDMKRCGLLGNYERNEDNLYDDWKETQDIDYALKQTSRTFPTIWWMLPDINEAATEADRTEISHRVIAQIQQHLLLIALHQPYLIHQLLAPPTAPRPLSSRSSFDEIYSQTVVLSSSREVLSRVIALRKFHRELSYRALDDKAFTASTMLLLIHLNGHRLGRANVHEHQRMHDLGLINDLISSIEEISCSYPDMQSSSALEVLRKLVQIEEDSANGIDHFTWIEEGPTGTNDVKSRINKEGFSLSMPYVGTIWMARKQPENSQPLAYLNLNSVSVAEHNATEYGHTSNIAEHRSRSHALTPLGSSLQPQQRRPVSETVDVVDNPTSQSSSNRSMQDGSQNSEFMLYETSAIDWVEHNAPELELDTV